MRLSESLPPPAAQPYGSKKIETCVDSIINKQVDVWDELLGFLRKKVTSFSLRCHSAARQVQGLGAQGPLTGRARDAPRVHFLHGIEISLILTITIKALGVYLLSEHKSNEALLCAVRRHMCWCMF